MALLAANVEKSLNSDLARVGLDPTGRFEAHKSAMERFVRALPLSSNIVLLVKKLDLLVHQMKAEKENDKNRNRAFLSNVHANSSIHLLKKREDELTLKIREYKPDRIDLINLAKETKIPKVIEKKIEIELPGINNVPDFIKKLPPELSSNKAYLQDYLVRIKNEVKIKHRLKEELENSKYNQNRVDSLLLSNVELENKLKFCQKQLRLHKVRLRSYFDI